MLLCIRNKKYDEKGGGLRSNVEAIKIMFRVMAGQLLQSFFFALGIF
jgi:hypothetical protein